MILFKKVNVPATGWLSNMSPHPINDWRTAEALFQALRFTDPEIQAKIQACKSPMSAKMVAKQHADRMVIKPRSPEDLALMERILAMKIARHPALERALLESGDQEIVEDVSSRQNESGLFWGAVVENGVIVRGENHLGKLWMKLRRRLQALKDLADYEKKE